MRVPFTAFAEDALIRGELLLTGDRLSDFIPQDGPFKIERVTIEALEDGRRLEVDGTWMTRENLVAITSSGPRGNSARRVRTRPHPARMQAGPFEILGYVHAPPSGHPFANILRRRVLPGTSAVVHYPFKGRTIKVACDVLLVNPTKIDWLEPATDDDLRLGKSLVLPSKVDPHAKDLTGELLG